MGKFHILRSHSLHSHREQGDCDHNQIQDVEGVTAEGAFVHEGSVHCHLSVTYIKVTHRMLKH